VTSLSPALLLAWDLAAHEAGQDGRSLIAPQHVFLGVCRLADYDTLEPLLELGYQRAEAQQILPELTHLMDVFRGLAIDPVRLRRDLRERPTGKINWWSGWASSSPKTNTFADRPRVIHRSAESRLLFTQADQLAGAQDAKSTTTVLHLLLAMLEGEGSSIPALLRPQDIPIDALTRAARDRLVRLT
jgi:hypothetical protein